MYNIIVRFCLLGGFHMKEFIVDIFVFIVAILLIVIVMLQSSKDDINDAFNGSKSDLFKNQKTRGVELFMQRGTAVMAIVFIALVITSVALHTR
ncbi:MAG: preprotein translocase subunit SecG [Erysipelotrichaceae bacterium]|nr:preprotein translocase subunit SecG [Erysipelotrichaceae bacterium]